MAQENGIMVKIKHGNLKKDIAGGQALSRKVEKDLKTRFSIAKEELIEDFNSHSVTREIEAGVNASNLSGTLSRGNLFSFLGFEENSLPVEDLRSVLDKGSKLKRVGKTSWVVEVPDSTEISSTTPLPWSAKSWALGIERGISGFDKFIFGKSDNSRSGGGIQSKNSVRSGEFRPIRYISAILERFIERLS